MAHREGARDWEEEDAPVTGITGDHDVDIFVLTPEEMEEKLNASQFADWDVEESEGEGEDYEEIGFAGEIMAQIRSETSIASAEEGVLTPVLRNRGRFRRTRETSSPSSTDSGVD